MVQPKLLSAHDRESLSAAATHFSAGRHAQAAALAAALCLRHPEAGLAHKLHGCALLEMGRAAEAVIALREAVRLLPQDAQAMSNLGNALAADNQLDAAIEAHERAIAMQPGVPTPVYNLGCVLLQAHRPGDALRHFLSAHALLPQDRELARLCRELLVERGDLAQAERFCRGNLSALPDDAGAAALLGAILLQTGEGQPAEAEGWLREAVRLAPDDAVSWSNLGLAQRARHEIGESIAAGRRAVALAPEWGQGWSNLGVALRDAGQLEEARTALLKALECDCECADAYYNLGCTAQDLGEHALAREALIEAVKRSERPAWILQAAHACRQVLDWDGAELLESAFAGQLKSGEVLSTGESPSPFAWLATPGSDPATQLQLARHFSARFPQAGQTQPRARAAGPLRVALLSADFRDHATAHLLAGAIEYHDPARFTLIAYDHGPDVQDSYRQRLQQSIREWVSVGALSDEAAACRMRDDGIDIAIDLKGWTQGYRGGILAYRPAPVQMQWLGFPGTMGAPWIDYIIADPVTIPPGAEAHYSERVLSVPGCYQPNDLKRAIGPRASRADLGLPEGAFVMAAFHQPYKITRAVFDQWMRLLGAIPNAILWLLEASPEAREAMIAATSMAGVDPGRLVWAPRMSSGGHLGRLAAADLALDAFPVNAHTTASDALWAGVPQVARCGTTFVSRVSASIVNAAGLPELVAHDDAAYEALILALAHDRPALAALRTRLQTTREHCALFDTAAFARHLGRGLEMAWARRTDGPGAGRIEVAD
ncbi:glycosyltransferase [Parazoarcus communis]|uniref:protein O-GlcNAc transferase n=1 Tax=Parazoarcus communis TaxID=41977 RepID=A0A2U8H7R3_9RHOO|nr:glycosyltransferase family 41 protein [Parazoarcus communis]AWI81610.1 glycosyltransferase [Parazoarcus communis]